LFYFFSFILEGSVIVRKIVNLSVVFVIACMMIAFYTGSITTYANEEAGHECVQCGKPADSHGGAVTVEHDGEHLTFCCQGCVNKHEKGHHDESSHKDDEHGHSEHEGHEKH
jgi:hypothetical protein